MSRLATGSPSRGGPEPSRLQAPSARRGSPARRSPRPLDEPELQPAGDDVTEALPDRVLVYARCRPFLEDGAANASPTLAPGSPSATPRGPKLELLALPESHKVRIGEIGDTLRSPTREAREFKFDGVFDGPSEQADVYTTVARPVLREALCGYHGCIMAYGQTGSGKTHTLLHPGQRGDLCKAGLVPRLAADLFIQTAADAFAKYEVSVGMVQIYNEQVDDLLCPDNHGLKVKQDITCGGWVVEGMAWRDVDSAAKLLEHITEARKRLVYAETKMNKHSSRSHCVVTLKIVRQEVPAALIGKDGSVTAAVASSVKVRQTEGKLTVVDLAGSERIKKSAAQDKRLKEAININTSLLMLGNVIQSLASRQSHVPFRDSALTRLLESSIGGNSRCAMIVCVAPEPVHISESLSTLEFASRAMRVETRPILHESTVDMDPKELAKSLSSQFESDVAMRSQVELAQLRHSLQAEARKAEESSRAARSAGAQVQELRRLLQEEAAGRQAAEAESREAMRKLSAKESALKKTMAAHDEVRLENVRLERQLADAKAAVVAASASTAAARDQARAAKETSGAVHTQLELEMRRRADAEAALHDMYAEEEARLSKQRAATAQTDPVVIESDDEDGELVNVRSSLPTSPFQRGSSGRVSDMPSARPSTRKAELAEMQAQLREKASIVAQLERNLKSADLKQNELKKQRDELEDALFQERQQRCDALAESEKQTEAKLHATEASMLRMGVVCTKRGRNGKEYTRVVRLSEDMSRLEWAAVTKFKGSLAVTGVEAGEDAQRRPLTTIRGPTRSTSIEPRSPAQQQWMAALAQHFSDPKDGTPAGTAAAAAPIPASAVSTPPTSAPAGGSR
eukprot:jgi/Tetstr1/465500/TSEL_000883.t1